MSLLDRVQRKAEEGSPPGTGASQPASPPSYPALVGDPAAAGSGGPATDPADSAPAWSLRVSLGTPAAPAAPPRPAPDPSAFTLPAPAPAPAPAAPLLGRTGDLRVGADSPRSTSLLSRTGDARATGEAGRPSPLLGRAGEPAAPGDGNRPTSLLSRTGIPRPGHGRGPLGAMYAQLRSPGAPAPRRGARGQHRLGTARGDPSADRRAGQRGHSRAGPHHEPPGSPAGGGDPHP